MSGWHCPTCGTINNTADERGNCKCERDRLVGMLERITASDECAGWDGRSRRCECGNRRVDWVSHGDFENPYVRGEAW